MARMYHLSRSTIQRYLKMAEEDPLGIDGLLELEDPELDIRFNPGPPAHRDRRYTDFVERVPYLKRELATGHMTVTILWEEYIEKVPDGYCLTQFRRLLKKFTDLPKASAVLKPRRRPGDEMQVDFAGDRMEYVDPKSGRHIKAETFVAILPYSGYTFVKFVPSQKIGHFLMAVEAAIRFFGGAPDTIVPDNLRSAVSKVGRWASIITGGMADLASHYGCNVYPTRAYRPRDKGPVEDAVNKAYMRIYPKLRGRTFHSIEEMNEAVAGPLDEYNSRPMHGCDRSRLDLFLSEEKPTLLPLPPTLFEWKRHKSLTVLSDGTILFGPERHRYSVPYHLIGEKVEVMYTSTLLSVYHKGKCVATHMLSSEKDGYTYKDEHLAPNVRAYHEYSPKYFIEQAAVYGEAVENVMRGLFSTGNPDHNYRCARGILRLADKTNPDVFRMACEAAVECGRCDYPFMEHMVQSECAGYLSVNGRTCDQAAMAPAPHVNIRGPQAFQ